MDAGTFEIKINSLDKDIIDIYDPDLKTFWGTIHIDLFYNYHIATEADSIKTKLDLGESVKVKIVEL